MTKTPDQTLHNVFGYSSFRPHQKEIIETLIRGEDAFVLMPTERQLCQAKNNEIEPLKMALCNRRIFKLDFKNAPVKIQVL